MFVLEALESKVAEMPNKLCISSPEESFTFLETDLYSNAVAKSITLSTSKEIVPLYIKGDDAYILPIVLGIMKAGKIPMPLPTSLSLNKSLERVSDVDYDLIVTRKEEKEVPETLSVYMSPNKSEFLDIINFENVLSDIAYIICTSGTTGVPKKVFLTQKNISWVLSEFSHICSFDETCKFLFSTPYTFDVSISEMFLPIFTGGELCCFSNTLKDTEKMTAVIRYIKEYQITHVSVSPSYAELLLEISDYEDYRGLKYLGLGGEAVGVTLAKKLLPILKNGTEVINMYGPSETTIYATYYKLTGHESNSVPIGEPLSGTILKILDDQSNSASKGELFIGGLGISAGYLLQPELSKEKFIEFDGEIFYRTGDFVYRNNQGKLVFETRKDNQVQVNGIRMELGEIDSIVHKIPDIRLCRSVYENKRIYIFYASKRKNDKIKKDIVESLPKYLNPIVVEVDKFILNQNRKFDARKMIEKYYFKKTELNNYESIQAELFKILNQFKVDSLDELDSLDTVRFFIELEDVFDIKLDDSLYFSFSTLAKVAEFLEGNSKRKIQEESHNNTLDEINLNIIVEGAMSEEKLETTLIPTLYHQKTYFLKKYNSILYFDIAIDTINYKTLDEIKVFFQRLSYHIDSLKFVLTKKDNLYFRKIKQEEFQPIIFVVESELSDDFIKKLLYDRNERYLFFIIAQSKDKLIRVYFSHHIMDKSSLFKISKLIKTYLENGEFSNEINSSYEDYINFVKKANNNLSIDQALKLIPKTEIELTKNNRNKESNIQIIKSKNIFKDSIDIAIESFYKFSQCLFKQNQTFTITGAMTANMRAFESFDASKVVGDTHITIPLYIERFDDFSQLKKRVRKLISKYQQGLNIKDKIFDGYPAFDGLYQIAKDRWDSVNAIVNYIGEVTNVKQTISEISEVGFDANYMVVFTHKSELYQVIFCRALLKEEYCIDIFEEPYIIKVKK
ncbi:AMP-binding protein [Listeria monocytogenes]|nr:AMP-binding protein [Listeria monocytogenes]